MKISQSFYKDMNNVECLYYLFLKYVKGLRTEPSEAMFKGLYFEWHLLGTVRSGEEPKFTPNKDGKRPMDQVRLDELVPYARRIMNDMGIDIAAGEAQVKIETDIFEGHLDLVTNDFEQPTRKAIYDVKYTDTKIDDRWNGWADAENNEDIKIQALHYIFLYHQKYGVYLPFYFLVFGKSGWVRVIKIVVSKEGMDRHIEQLGRVNDKLTEFSAAGWKASPEYNRCRECGFFKVCPKKSTKPKPEVINI